MPDTWQMVTKTKEAVERLLKKEALYDRTASKVEGLRGYGIVNTPYSLSIGIPVPRRQVPASSSEQIRWGAVTGGDWTAGATMSLNPCSADGVTTGAPTVTVNVKKDGSSYSMANSTVVPMDTVVPYVQGSDGFYVLGDDPRTVSTGDMQVDGNNFQLKTRDTWGTFSGSDSDWVTWHTGEPPCEE